MANWNEVTLIGRVVAEPEDQDIVRFQGGGQVVRLRFVVNNRKYDKGKGDWVDDPVWVDLKFFDSDKGPKLATQALKLKKGESVFVKGHLVLEQWESDGGKRQKMLVYVDKMQFLGGKGGDEAPAQDSRGRDARRDDSRPRDSRRDDGRGRDSRRDDARRDDGRGRDARRDDDRRDNSRDDYAPAGGNDDDIPF